MLGRTLSILALASAVVAAIGLKLRADGNPLGDGILWGLGGGLVAAISAIGGAVYAVVRKLPVNQALAIVVVGMLARMLFLAALTYAAVKVASVHPLGFAGGFGAIYLVGQLLEVRILARLGTKRAS